jgi:hypothetical protein
VTRTRWLILLGVLCAGALYLFWNPNAEIFLVPDGYKGPIVVAFSHPRGVKRERTLDAYVYRIPNDGILRIKDSIPNGYKMVAWYYVDAKGNRTPIPHFWPEQEQDRDKLTTPHVAEMEAGGKVIQARIVIPSDLESFYPATHFTTEKVAEEYTKQAGSPAR